MPKQDQTIIVSPINDFVIGVSDPIILSAAATSGIPLEVVITHTNGGIGFNENNGIIDVLQPGTVTITLNQPGDDNYNPAPEQVIQFDAVDGDFFERTMKINDLNNKLGADSLVLPELNKLPVGQIQTLEFKFYPNSAQVIVNGNSFDVSLDFIAKKFVRSSMAFFRNELIAQATKLNQLIAEAKAL